MLLHLHCHSVAASGKGGRKGARSKIADINRTFRNLPIELFKIYRTSMHYMGRSQILKAREASPTTVVPN